MATYEEETVPQQAPQRSWFGRNWWWVLLLVILGGGLVCAGICSGFFFVGLKALKGSEPYQMTLDAVRGDPEVVERLGEPIEDGLIPQVQMNIRNDQGDATLMIPISGPKGAADVRSDARMIAGKWGLTRVEVTFSDNEKHIIDVGGEAGGGLDEAPAFIPPGEPAPGTMPPDAG